MCLEVSYVYKYKLNYTLFDKSKNYFFFEQNQLLGYLY
jgi:hypothetical protein